MYTTYHLASAEEINSDFLDAVKAIYKAKPITIIVEEGEGDFELSTEMKTVLDDRLAEDEQTYLSADKSIKQLREKYGV